MEVHGDDPVGPGRLDRPGADSGPDRHPRLVLLVALGVAEVGDEHGDGGRARSPERIDPEQQLDKVVVRRKDGRLDEVDLAAADVLADLWKEVAVGEANDLATADVDVEIVADTGGQPRAPRATEHKKIVIHCHHRRSCRGHRRGNPFTRIAPSLPGYPRPTATVLRSTFTRNQDKVTRQGTRKASSGKDSKPAGRLLSGLVRRIEPFGHDRGESLFARGGPDGGAIPTEPWRYLPIGSTQAKLVQQRAALLVRLLDRRAPF